MGIGFTVSYRIKQKHLMKVFSTSRMINITDFLNVTEISVNVSL